MSDSNLYFPIIKYTINEHIFTIQPTEYYSIPYDTYVFDKKTYSHIKTTAYRPVIFYKFTYNGIESIIPLYVSDGKTNRFRGNLLLPFLCIESGGLPSEHDACPLHLVHPHQNDVYKLDPCEDLNTEKLFTEIMDNIKKKDVNYEHTEKHKKLTDDAKKGIGLYTVLPRMKSFIVFLLNIINYKIKYVIENNISADEFNALFQPYANENNEISQYYVTTKTLLIEDGSSLEPYIIELVNLFKELYIDVLKNKNVSIEFIEKKYTDLINIDVSTLNNKINVCSDNKINYNYYQNYQKFNTISLTLSEIYKITQQKLSNFIDDSPRCNILTKSLNAFHLDCNSEIALFFSNFNRLKESILNDSLIDTLLSEYMIFNPKYTDFLNQAEYNRMKINIIIGNNNIDLYKIAEIYNDKLTDIINILNTDEYYNKIERNRNDKQINDLFREFNLNYNLILVDKYNFAEKKINVEKLEDFNLDIEDIELEYKDKDFITYKFPENTNEILVNHATTTATNLQKILTQLYEYIRVDYKQKYLKYKSKYIKLKYM